MEFRKAAETDLQDIMKIIRQAQAYFKNQKIDQWQNQYPNEETIRNDINQGYGYLLLDGKSVAATAAVSFEGERTYDTIYGGRWLSSGKYAVIHRIAVDDRYKGLGYASEFLHKIEQICLKKEVFSLKVDTHEENHSMQRLLRKNYFRHCGTIYLADGGKRMAFEKLLVSRPSDSL